MTTSLNLLPERLNIDLQRGAPITLTLTATDGSDAPVDLSEVTVVASVLTRAGVVAASWSQEVSGDDDNVLTLSLTGLASGLLGDSGYLISVTVDGFPWLGGLLAMHQPGSSKGSSGYTSAFDVTTDGVDLAVNVQSIGGGLVAPADVLAALLTVDGAGSGLDADLLDGQSSAAFAAAGHDHSGTYQPVDADLTALAAAGNSTVLAATTASFLTADETKLDGIETAATADQTAAEILAKLLTVDGAGSGLDADLLDGNSSAAFQPIDSDLTAIAALTTTSYGRAFLALADGAAARTAIGAVIGTDVQAYDADLAAIAALTTTSYGRAFLALANAAAGITALGLDSDLATFAVPASTTISAFGKTLVDDADGAAARTTLGITGAIVRLEYDSGTGWPSRAGIPTDVTVLWVNRVDDTEPSGQLADVDLLVKRVVV